MSTKQKTCAERVQSAFDSCIGDIQSMMSLERDDVTLGDDGTLDTVIYPGTLDAITYSDTSEYRDEDTGELDLDAFLDDYFDDIREQAYEQFCEYGLSFDYVEPHTFTDQDEGYLRYQISWGGPSEEFRFYVSPYGDGFSLYRAEFWYLDWFDGACVTCTSDDRVRMLFDWFNDCGSVQHAIREAA